MNSPGQKQAERLGNVDNNGTPSKPLRQSDLSPAAATTRSKVLVHRPSLPPTTYVRRTKASKEQGNGSSRDVVRNVIDTFNERAWIPSFVSLHVRSLYITYDDDRFHRRLTFSARTMMTLLRSFAVLVLLAALAVARCRAQKNTTSCLESLDSVFLAERDVEDESILRSYVLCPNTTFSIASAFNESGGPIEGQYPLKIARSNIHVLCGEDGSSANECVLEGGMEQLVFVDLYESNHSVTNVLVQGLTFSKAKTRNAAVKNKGQLSLVDCIFKVPCASPRWSFRQFASTSHPHSVAPHQDNNNRKLIEVSEEDVELDVLLNISECVFSDNQVWSFSALTIEGLVSVYGGTVHLSHSVFVRNTIAESETTKLEYAVGLYHGSLALDNTCFLDNDDRLAPLAREGGELKVFSSSVQRNSTTLPVSACGFVSDGDLGRYGFNASGFSCQKADSPVCTASALAKVEPSCYRSFSEIDYNEEFLNSDDTTRTYRLCENHTYQIRNFDADDDDRENTTTPLIVGRSNVNILCGASGSSRNNCTLHGGTYQFTVHDEYRVGTTFQNVLVQGLTFKAATTYNFLTSTNNDVTLKDCVFTVRCRSNGEHARMNRIVRSSFHFTYPSASDIGESQPGNNSG